MKSVYFIGIKGVGMCGLAQILKALGYEVYGSDVKEKFFTDEVLKKLKIKVFEGFKRSNLFKNFDLVIVSQAYATKYRDKFLSNNPEVKEALRRKMKVITYPEAVASIFNQSFGIAICGSHGKSTTSAMIAEILRKTNRSFIALIGSEVLAWRSNAFIRVKNTLDIKKNIFVLEADEYREAFLNYKPKIIVLTNIDYDHPDYFSDKNKYRNAFRRFINNLTGKKILITETKLKIPKNIKVIKPSKLKFNLRFKGEHYEKNANLAYTCGRILGIDREKIKKALENYRGIRRRFEIVGKFRDCILIDDYAHHPTEIESVLESLKNFDKDLNKIWIIFQPHTYSRTLALFPNFVKVLKKIPKLIILKSYSSAREKLEKGKTDPAFKLYYVIKKVNNQVKYFVNHEDVVKFLKEKVSDETAIVTIGAGDVWKILNLL